jgi:hypothetical protein
MDSKLWCESKIFTTVIAELLNFKAEVMPVLKRCCNLCGKANLSAEFKGCPNSSGSERLISPCEVLRGTQK